MSLRSLSVRQLRAELARRERGAARLAVKRDRLQSRLDDLLAELTDLGVDGSTKRRGRPPGSRNKVKRGRKGKARLGRPKGSKNRKPGRPKGKRARNAMSLADAVSKVVAAGRTVSPAEVMGSIKKVYKSTSKNLGMMVANTLAKHPEFKRIGRGQYLRTGGKRTARVTTKARRRPARKATRARAPKVAARRLAPSAARPASRVIRPAAKALAATAAA